MHFDFNEAVFPVEESSSIVIKILFIFQLKYTRELLILSQCSFRKKQQEKASLSKRFNLDKNLLDETMNPSSSPSQNTQAQQIVLTLSTFFCKY